VPHGLAVVGWAVIVAALAGCGIVAGPGTQTAPPQPVSAGTPVTADTARILADAPTGGRLTYRLVGGFSAVLVLGPIQQSGLGEVCRIGRVNASEVGPARPTAYAFCRRGDQWYEMTPVVVSGY
jgi:hypothetical protein